MSLSTSEATASQPDIALGSPRSARSPMEQAAASIPTYPNFALVSRLDLGAIEPYTRPYPPYADFGDAILRAWDTDGTCAVSVLHGNLVVRFKRYRADGHFYSFLGANLVVKTARTLLERSRREGLLPRLELVPEVAVVADDRLHQEFRVEEDPDNHDYVYKLIDWDALAGRTYRKHRRQVTHCRRAAALDFRQLDLTDGETRAAISSLFRRWAARRPAALAADSQIEWAALHRFLDVAAADRFGGCGLYDGGSLVAFSLWEGAPGDEYVVTHFRKADRTIEGLTACLRHEECRVLLERGHRLMNIEQDLGIPGLRAYKRSLRPSGFLRKYVISERP